METINKHANKCEKKKKHKKAARSLIWQERIKSLQGVQDIQKLHQRKGNTKWKNKKRMEQNQTNAQHRLRYVLIRS